MLVLTRKKDERILIEPDVEIVIVELFGNRVRVGIKAPPHVAILRGELLAEIDFLKTTERFEGFRGRGLAALLGHTEDQRHGEK